MECWLVRHGESTWNLDERFQGGQDPPLSRRGQVQAAALAARLAGMAFTGLYTSPMTRARETAAACAPVVGLTPEPVDDLREMGLGAWEGLTVKAVQATGDAYRRWIDAPADHPPPGGEPLDVVVTRTGRALERVGRVSGGGPVLVVSHGGVIASLLCRWLGLSLNELWRFRLANASITRVVLPAGRLIVLNDTSHLIDTPAGAAAP